MNLLDSMLNDAAQYAAPEPAPAASPAPVKPTPAAVEDVIDGILAETLATPRAVTEARVADPYGLGTYVAPAEVPAIPADPSNPVSVDALRGATVRPTLAESAAKAIAAFVAPPPNLNQADIDRLGLIGFAKVLPNGDPGVLCAGLARSGMRCMVTDNGVASYVVLGRQVSPGVWSLAGEETDGVRPVSKRVCPGSNHCRTHGWLPGTAGCAGWIGVRGKR